MGKDTARSCGNKGAGEKILTIIIPAYNVANYIDQCLQSILAVGTDICRLEILVVNDGSEDTTEHKVREYEKQYPDCIHLLNKENGGHGSAVNYGIRCATGKYCKVLDGDDWVETEELQHFLKSLEQGQADVIVSPFMCVIGAEQKRKKWELELPVQIKYNEVYDFDTVCGDFLARMHQITYRTSLLQEHGIQLDEHSFYVDMEYILFPIPYVQTVRFCQECIYMYRLGNESQSVSVQSMQRNQEQHRNILNRLLQFYDEQVMNYVTEKKQAYIARGIACMYENQLQIYLSMPRSKEMKRAMQEFDDNIRIQAPAVYQSSAKRSVRILRWRRFCLYTIGKVIYSLTK